MRNYIIFSDLDGTLLDHKTYTFDPALEALSVIKSRQIPLILSSSKTRVEIERIQSHLTLKDPFIFENGSGVFYNNQVVSFGINLTEIRNKITPLQKTFNFNCYSLLTIKQAIHYTGLTEEEAKLSQQRQFSEPIIWLDDEERKNDFLEKIHQLGLNATQGGRFLTISSHHDKAKALKWIKNSLENDYQTKFISIALGDGENDISMINACDIKILIKNNNEHLQRSDWVLSEMCGPSGWNQEIMKVLNNE
jgi:mannosyl-3-phosphoglycerate phosphatase